MIMKVTVITANLQKKHYFGLYRKWRLYWYHVWGMTPVSYIRMIMSLL